MFNNIKKIFRLLRYRKRIFGVIGNHNVFEWSVYIHEIAKIGNNNYIGPYVMINNATVGNYCSLGPSVKIGQGQHSKEFITTYQKISQRIINHSLNTTRTIIKNDVWIGANAVIMQGVTIGNGAVIGANAVVTENIPDYAVAVGIPAKVIKFRFDKEKISKINKTTWYDYDFETAIEKIKELNSIE